MEYMMNAPVAKSTKFIAKKALTGKAKKWVNENLFDDPYDIDVDPGIPGATIVGLNGAEKATEEVMRDLTINGIEPGYHSYHYESVWSDISNAVRNGASVEGAKEHAFSKAVQNTAENLNKNLDELAGRIRADTEKIKEAIATSKSTLENWSKVQALTDERLAQQEKDRKEQDKGVALSAPGQDVSHAPVFDWDEINAPDYTPDESRDEPVGGNDRSDNGWSGMGQNEEWHEGGLVSDHDPVLGEAAVSVNAQEGEFVLSRAAVALLGEDLLARINDALRHGDRQTAGRLRHVFHAHLSPEPALPEADIKALMSERPYWDSHHPDHPASRAWVAREFRVAFPGYSNMDKDDHIGGLITDHDPDTYLDDFRLDIPEEAFVVSRIATRLAGIPALARLNALAEGGDPALAAHLKRDLQAVFGMSRPTDESELRAMMRDRRYTDQSHPEHMAYCKMIAREFRRAFPD
ncbi:MAG: hypothetical protein MI741_17400 [Rhodospirillales bacterium]|nr:hypothetical protein [Rhodospirillales bacterium]